MSSRKKTPTSKQPLKREDLHKRPRQGTRVDTGAWPHPHPSEAPAWGTYASFPMVMRPYGAGASGFTSSDVHAPGRFRGVAPRNYAKTDARILEDVCELLTRHGELDVGDVDVHCRNGVIRLEGHVPVRWMRREIEAVAESVGGVNDVENELGIHS